MGSLCSGKPATTTTSSVNTTTPRGLEELRDIWSRVSDAASTPYTPYGGQMVADLNQTQQSGISNVNNAFGSAQPYFDTAAAYARTGASPISDADIGRFMSPYTSRVIDATRANFAEDNAQQHQMLLGNASAKNALGGNRVGIMEAELARKQKLAQDPIVAGLYNNAYTQALGAAQADRGAAAQGASAFGALAPSVQNAQLQGAQAQIGAGSVAQNNEQQKLAANYNQYLQALAFPYQQAQFLTSAGLPTVTAFGGTTTGNSTKVEQPAQASPLSQIAGIGMAGLGLMTGNPMMAMGALGGMGSMFGGGSQGLGGNPNQSMAGYDQSGNFYNYAARGGRIGMKHGGRTPPRRSRFADGGFVDQVHAIRQALRGGGRVIDTQRDPNGIYVPKGYADGGSTDQFYSPFGNFAMDFSDRFAPAAPMVEAEPAADSAFWNQYVAGKQAPMAPMADVPMPQPRPEMDAAPVAIAANPAAAIPPEAALTAGPSPFQMPPMMPQEPAPSGPFGLSEDARMGMIAAGLGMMASRNPNGLGAIGEGGLAGLKHYADTRTSRQRNELAARELIQDAEQFAKTHGLSERRLDQTTQHNIRSEKRAETMLDRGKHLYLGPSPDGKNSVFLNQVTGETEERPIQIGAKPTEAKNRPIPASVLKDLGEKGQALSTLNELGEGFDPKFAGWKSDKVADLMNEAARRGFPSGASKEAAQWWQDYDRYKAVVRNKLFGSALTAAEIAQWNKFDAKPSQSPEAVKNNIEQQRKVVEQGLRRRADSLAKQGYSKEAINAEIGFTMDSASVPPSPSGAPASTTPATTGSAPPRPSTVPAGSQYSPSRGMWRDPSGRMYDKNGAAVQ